MLMTDRFTFLQSAAGDYAFLVIDTWSGQQVAGTVIKGGEDDYRYQRAFWNGTRLVHDTICAESFSALSKLIDAYLEPRI